MYIRVKDGVYEIDKNTKGTEEFLWVKTNKANIVQCVWVNCIIKQADTIEELCDDFVIEFSSDGVNQIIYPEFQWAKKEFLINKKGTLYGAIRVLGKGLIYVAKMNENGEMELI